MTNQTATQNAEIVGRKFKRTAYTVHRRIVGEERWFRTVDYKTLEEAQQALSKMGKPMRIGQLGVVTHNGPRERYECRIIEVIKDCTVLHVEQRDI